MNSNELFTIYTYQNKRKENEKTLRETQTLCALAVRTPPARYNARPPQTGPITIHCASLARSVTTNRTQLATVVVRKIDSSPDQTSSATFSIFLRQQATIVKPEWYSVYSAYLRQGG